MNMLDDFVIIRTSFFDPEKITFPDSPDDMYSSKLPIKVLARNIKMVAESNFVGTVNVGGARMSDFARHSEHKPDLKKCKREDLQIDFPIYHDASLDSTLWHSIL